MPARNCSVYLANSMAMENMEPSSIEMVLKHHPRKRRQHRKKILRVLDMNSVNFPQLRYQSKSKVIHKSFERVLANEKNCLRCWKKLKGTNNTNEIEKAEEEVVQQRNRKRSCNEIEAEVGQQRNQKRSRNEIEDDLERKLRQTRNQNVHDKNFIDVLPEDLVLEIMIKFSASATAPSDIVNARLACKKFNDLVQRPCVLARASARSLSVRAELWSESAHEFLKMCAEAGNLEACYMLGMIYFYCDANRRDGAAYMAKAAMGSHPSALYSLAIIQFNGSGGSKSDKNLPAGVALCIRAAHLGHINAIRELGYCLQDGYGIRRHVEQGRRYLCAASNLELHYLIYHLKHLQQLFPSNADLLREIALRLKHAIAIPGLDQHPVNRFLVDWWRSRAEAREEELSLRACSHVDCGRVETRQHEFRRCSVCGKANYCSRACQAIDWKRAHRKVCVPPPVPEGPPVGVLEEQFVAQLAQDLV